MQVFVGAIADDDTGATDLAGMLTEQGMRVNLVLAGAGPRQLKAWAKDCDAVVIGTASRSIAKEEAYARTFAAAEALKLLHPKVIAIKYCSTFDSTAEGKIGASIDAAMDATGERFTIALAALPALGRTTYMGYHFVGQQLLSNSAMRHHPLNPMTNSHLPSHLQTQTARRVGLVTCMNCGAGAEQLRARLAEQQQNGIEIAVLDCIDDRQLQLIGEVIFDMPLLSGSSAWGMVLPQIWRQRCMWAPTSSERMPARARGGKGFLIVSGSCSQATRRQNAWAAQQGSPTFYLDVFGLLQGEPLASELIAEVTDALVIGSTCLLSTTSGKEVELPLGISSVEAGERIAQALAQTVARIFKRCVPAGLVIAGGETSSTLMRTLGLGGLRIGPNIEPGIPVCVALARPELGVVLKSGNFGSADFYGRAIEAIRGLPAPAEIENEDKR